MVTIPDLPKKFLSTPSARRATPVPCRVRQGGSISIHALREEGDWWMAIKSKEAEISIHALREEGDDLRPPAQHDHSISIHALREEGDSGFQS